jgi:hypothetical protein
MTQRMQNSYYGPSTIWVHVIKVQYHTTKEALLRVSDFHDPRGLIWRVTLKGISELYLRLRRVSILQGTILFLKGSLYFKTHRKNGHHIFLDYCLFILYTVLVQKWHEKDHSLELKKILFIFYTHWIPAVCSQRLTKEWTQTYNHSMRQKEAKKKLGELRRAVIALLSDLWKD